MTELIERFDGLEPQEQASVAHETLKALAESDFYFFSKYILGYGDLNRPTHKEAIRVLMSDAHRKFVIMPRGTFKSTLVSVAYPLWLLTKRPWLSILLDSEIYTNSKNFGREIRQHMRSNDRLRMVWGPWIGPIDTESEFTIAQRPPTLPSGKPAHKEASITVGGIETVKVGQHYDVIIGDDYNSPKNSDTPEKCSKVIDHVRYNLNILNPGGEYVFAATRYAERDVPGFFFKEILNMPHLAEGKLTSVNTASPIADDPDRLINFG